jgi:hypothetical protein
MRAVAAFDVARVNPAKLLPLFAAGSAAFLLPAVAAAAPSCGTGGVLSGADPTWTCTYTTVGEDQFAVPARAGDLTIFVAGASGQATGAPAGLAVSAQATFGVSPGTTLWVEVGGAGWAGNGSGDADGGLGGSGNGGGTSGGRGGGSSDVRTAQRGTVALTADPLTDPRLLVAGGGGGAGGSSGMGGGSGGNATTPNGGGAGAAGDAGASASSGPAGGGGGGGGGWFGGAGGAAGTAGTPAGTGGLGGTSYVPPGGTVYSTAGGPFARVTITWTESPEPPPVAEPSATPAPLVPVIGLLSQASGSTAGGDALTISGENFLVGSQVRFGGIPALSVTVDRFDRLTAIAPPHEPGTVRVEVRNDAGDSPVVAAGTYTYVGDPAPVPPATAPVPPPATTATPATGKATQAKPKKKPRSKATPKARSQAKPKVRSHRRGRG